MKANAPLAKLDIASVYGTEGWGFELLMVRQSRPESYDSGRLFVVKGKPLAERVDKEFTTVDKNKLL